MNGSPELDPLDLTVRELLDQVAARTPAPGAGAVAAIVVALAASLTGMSARFSARGDDSAAAEAEAVGTRADVLRRLAAPLAKADIEAYRRVLESSAPDGSATRRSSDTALDEATRVPLEVAQIAVEVANLASGVAQHGNPRLRGDATTAAVLGAAAAMCAAVLVAENLAELPSDTRRAAAAELARQAREASADVLQRYQHP